MKIHESAENYLETILMLSEKNNHVRAVDIANELSFTKASVSIALKALKEGGYITVEESSKIRLTADGLAVAEKIYERHKVLAKALMSLGVPEEIAYRDSCKIEHDISSESFEMIKKHMTKNGMI